MKRAWQIFWHLLFWLSMISLFVFLGHSGGKMPMKTLLVIFVVFGVINIALFYLNYLLLIPKYLDVKKYKHYAI
ncbi:hypothetical protein QN352_19295, partial [Mucilaginibacter sp. 10I4]|nr:hypothetical protein [Mucilaginibacter sp. 10I4]